MKTSKHLILLATIPLMLSGCGGEKPHDGERPEAAYNNVASAPTAVLDVTDYASYKESLTKLDTIIYTLNSKLEIIDKDNNKLDDFIEKFKIINPMNTAICARIETTEIADTFIEKVKDDSEVLDLMIMSKSKEVINHIKAIDHCKSFAVAYDVSNLPNLDYDAERLVANSIGAGILVVGQSQLNKQKIRYTQNMSKCVWTYCDEVSQADYYTCMSSGAFGIINKNIYGYNDAFRHFGDITNKVILRTQFNISHRGDAHNYAENSIASCRAALEAGAEALELDFHRTADNSIVCMHDKTTDKTCDGKLVINESTDEEIKKLRIVKGFGGEDVEPQPIPFMSDVAALLNEFPNAILYAEIKSKDAAFPELFVKDIQKYNLENRIVIINFESLINPLAELKDQYTECRKYMPTLWGSDLIWSPITSFSSVEFKNRHAMGYDCNITTGTILEPEYIMYMKSRGLMPYFWTLIDTKASIPEFYKMDVYGMTNNYACEYKSFVKNIDFADTFNRDDVKNTYKCKVTTYGGEQYDVMGQQVSFDDNKVVVLVFVNSLAYIVSSAI